jgi:2-oxoglutarate ferredoxin oxidoreductase subunit beta
MPLWLAFKKAAVQKGWDNKNSVMVAGIGCHGHIVNFTKLTSFEGLHGRPIPVATGIKMANDRLNVFVFTGDGDCLAEGGNHFIHASRRNHDITIMIHDNGLYALTTGQTSPATPHDYKSKSTPGGNPDYPLNPVAVAIAAGATFVARAYASDIAELQELIVQANDHKGVSIIDIMQPCVTFNKQFTHEFFQENTYYLDNDYDPTDKVAAFEKAQEFGLKTIPLGVIYKEDKPSYESQLTYLDGKPLVEQNIERKELNKLFEKYV